MVSPHVSLHGVSQGMPLGASGEILRVVKENEVELEPSRRTPACVEPETAGTSPASPQHHFTALRDMGDAHSQPLKSDSPRARQRPDAFCKSQELPRAGAEGLQLVDFVAGLFLGLALTFGLCCLQEISFLALGQKQK